MDNKIYRKQQVDAQKNVREDFKNHLLSIKDGSGFLKPTDLLLPPELYRNDTYVGKVTLRDNTVIDPCIINCFSAEESIFSDETISWYSHYLKESFFGAGELMTIEPSEFTIPTTLYSKIETTTFDYRMGSWMPVNVSVKGNASYIVKPFHQFFYEPESGFKGKDLDLEYCELPVEEKQLKGLYKWSLDFDDVKRIFMVHS